MSLLAAAGIAAGSGLLNSLISSYTESEARKREQQARENAAKELRQQGQITDAQYQNLINEITNYYNQRGSLGQLQDAIDYRKAIQGYNPEDYTNIDYSKIINSDANGNFNVDYNKEDFVNPYYNSIIGNVRDQIQHTAAGAGLGRGTGAALGIAQGVASKSDELYRTAMQDYQNERNFDYQKYQDAIANNWRTLNAMREGQQYKLGLQSNLAQDYYNAQDQSMSDILKAQQDKMNAQQTYAAAISSLY